MVYENDDNGRTSHGADSGFDEYQERGCRSRTRSSQRGSFRAAFGNTVKTALALMGFTAATTAFADAPEQALPEAPNELAEIVVTAQKRAQNLQDVPIAVTALSGSELADRGVTTVEDLSNISAGVQTFNEGGSDALTVINIRGG